MFLRLPVEVRFMVYRNLTHEDVRHVVVGLAGKPSFISKSERDILSVCSLIRAEFLLLVFSKCRVELHAHPYHHAWPIRQTGIAFTYQPSGDAPWALNFLQSIGSNVRFLGPVKVIQKLNGSDTIDHKGEWTPHLRVLYESLRSYCNIDFEPERDELVSQPHNISLNITNWMHVNYLQARIPGQTGPELVFEYQLGWIHGEAWGPREVERLCDVHSAVWRVPGQRFFLY